MSVCEHYVLASTIAVPARVSDGLGAKLEPPYMTNPLQSLQSLLLPQERFLCLYNIIQSVIANIMASLLPILSQFSTVDVKPCPKGFVGSSRPYCLDNWHTEPCVKTRAVLFMLHPYLTSKNPVFRDDRTRRQTPQGCI